MRKAAKFSLSYLLVLVATFIAARQFIPQHLDTIQDQLITAVFAVVLFVLLPFLYWRWVIKVGNKKAWRLLIALSLSSLVARYTFPDDIARYFEFIVWLRYPFITILLLIEFALMFSIVRVLWQSRHLSGDPRLSVFDSYKDKPAEHLDLALTFSYEPASWYYAIPYLSRKHVKSLAKLKLYSASRWTLAAIFFGLLVASTLSYFALLPVSELLAIVVSTFVAYGVVMATANYRVSRYYSVYVSKGQLIMNNDFLNLMAVDLNEIEQISQGNWRRDKKSDDLYLGTGDVANIEIRFRSPQNYYALMGFVTEKVDKVRLSVQQDGGIDQLLVVGQRKSVN